MGKNFSSNTPIYVQIMDMIKHFIVTGRYDVGSKIPSVRDLAVEYGVNPNTMQKALTKLEEDGLLYSDRTTGRFVTQNSEIVENLKSEVPRKIMEKFLQDMEKSGIEIDKVITYLERLRTVNKYLLKSI